MEEHTPVWAQAMIAMLLGAFGAVARLVSVEDPKPMLRKALLLRMAGEGSLGLGAWMIGYFMIGLGGAPSFVMAWIAGALGYAACHDALLRLLNQKIG